MITLATGDTIAGVASVASQLTCTIFGMELNGTTETYKVLYQGQLASSAATIYTAPASNVSFIRSITVVNNDTVTRTFSLYRGGTANSNKITPTISLLPSGMAIYEDGLGWQFFDSVGHLQTASGANQLGLPNTFGISGSLAETLNRNECPEVNATIPTLSGTLFMQAIYLPAGTVVTNITMSSATTAAGTPTHWMFGLFDSNRNLLASSADQTSTAWAANTLKTLAMTAAYTVVTSGLYYIGMFMAATTIITMKGGTAKTNGALAGTAPILHGTSTTGLTTAMPNPAAAITAGLVNVWAAVT